jgi:hypothetical protein
MNGQGDNGRGFLKDKLETFRVEPPTSVWNAISARLGRQGRRSMVIITLATAASVALAVTLGITYFSSRLPEEGEVAEVPAQPSGQPAVQPATQPGEQTRLEEKVAQAVQEVLAEQPVPVQEIALNEATAPEEEAGPEEVSVPDEEAGLNEEISLDEEAGLDTETGLLDPGEADSRDPRWVVGAALSPLYSFRDAEAQALAGTADHESGMLSYSGGVRVGYRARKRLAIETGIYFNKMGIAIGSPGIQLFPSEYDFTPIDAMSGRANVMAISNTVGNIVSRSGDIYVNNYKLGGSEASNTLYTNDQDAVYADQGIRQHLDYLEVPFNLRYTVVDRNIEIQLVGGLSTNLLVNNYVTMETGEGTTEVGYLTNIRNVNYSGNVGVGLVYHMMEHLSLSLEPRFRYFLHSVNDVTLPSTRPYAFGFYTGLSYFF